MPGGRTEITEIATALGMTPHADLAGALAARPPEIVGVGDAEWNRLQQASMRSSYRIDFEGAFANGRAFREAQFGLRGRAPLRIEWKGPHRAPAYEFLPADLRIDHVFLVSCKHDSHILANTSPGHLFDDLQWGRIEPDRSDWFEQVAPIEYQAFYEAVRSQTPGGSKLPALVTALGSEHRATLKQAFSRSWPALLEAPYADFAHAVALASAARWRDALASTTRRELALWRLLRMGAAPYFLLGEAGGERLRIRVATPWDWRQHFELRGFGVAARAGGQPRVDWEARVRRREDGADLAVSGFVEIRWSHGRFSGAPEAKVQLASPHSSVPGYFPLT